MHCPLILHFSFLKNKCFFSRLLRLNFYDFDFLSGGLRLKRDITEYAEFVRSFNAPSVDEKFEVLGM